MTDELNEEISCIEAILMDGLSVQRHQDGRAYSISVQVLPLTASDLDKSYVGLQLQMQLPSGYPATQAPTVEIKNPRGLDEEDLRLLLKELRTKCHDFLGQAVLFELIDHCREFLTARNVPVCPCVICLHQIVAEDEFIKTECYHYFHSLCFGRYLFSLLDQPHGTAVCPVCRSPLSSVPDAEQLLASKPPFLEESEPSGLKGMSEETKALRAAMQALYLKQKEAGGIIDLEEENKKFLVIVTPATEPTNASASTTAAAATATTVRDCPAPSGPQPPAPAMKSNKKGHPRGFRHRNHHTENSTSHRSRGKR